MKALSKKSTAISLMCLMIIAGFFFGTMLSGKRLQSDIEDIFFSGEDGSGIGVASDMNIKAKAALNLGTVAKRYMDSGDSLIEAADEASLAFSSAVTLNEKREANDLLDSAFTALFDAMGQLDLSEKDEKLRQSLNADFASAVKTMSHDPYNEKAVEYNRNIGSFPAKLVFSLTGIEPAPIFR